jgi:predicted nuclease of predicted toxin-antitoxin system
LSSTTANLQEPPHILELTVENLYNASCSNKLEL